MHGAAAAVVLSVNAVCGGDSVKSVNIVCGSGGGGGEGVNKCGGGGDGGVLRV